MLVLSRSGRSQNHADAESYLNKIVYFLQVYVLHIGYSYYLAFRRCQKLNLIKLAVPVAH